MYPRIAGKLTALLASLALLVSLPAAPGVTAAPAPAPAIAKPAAQPAPPLDDGRIYNADGTIDVGPVLRDKDLPLDLDAAELGPGLAGAQLAAYGLGDTRIFLGLDDYFGEYFLTQYEVRVISQTVEIWVQRDLRYKTTEGDPNPVHPDADDPEQVTDEKLLGLATRLEQIIRPTDLKYFGAYEDRDGSEALLPALAPALELPADYYKGSGEGVGQRLIILVSNVRDGNFYDPVNNSSFIGGFFSGTLGAYADRNIISIDSKQWSERVGPPNYDFDATIAHELQHLIHADYHVGEDTWSNEGLSEFAEFLNGFRPDTNSHRTQFSDYPENSLVLWGDQDEDEDQGFEILADYQQSYWFYLYLAGRLREANIGVANNRFLSDVAALTRDPALSRASIDALLTRLDAPFTFDQLWDDFRIAMLSGGTSDDFGWSSYIGQYSPPSGIKAAPLDLGRLRRNLTFEGYDTPGVPPYGSDYIEIGWSAAITPGATLAFNGDPELPTEWQVIPAATTGITPTGAVSGTVLYSGHTDRSDNFVIFPVSVPASGDRSLSFDTLYDIEQGWDFGFVQATVDVAGAKGFVSLPISGTTTISDTDALPLIKANVPGFSGISGGGDTPAWVRVSYDLSAYAGKSILLAFRYSTDPNTAGNGTDLAPGWYLDNLKVGATALYTNEATVPASAKSIWQARGLRNQFKLDLVTFGDKDSAGATRSAATLSQSGDGSFNLGGLLSRPGFNEAGERAVVVISSVPPPAQADVIGVPVAYAPYKLTGLPSSLYTSRARALGTSTTSSVAVPTVFPGDNITVTVTLDNLGRNDDLSAAPSAGYLAVPLPPQTTFVQGSGKSDVSPANLRYVPNLRALDAALPGLPGVYWSGTVSRTVDLSFALRVDPNVLIGQRIAPRAYIANGEFSSSPSQSFVDLETPVRVVAPVQLTLSGPTPAGNIPVNGTATYTYTLLNTDNATRLVDFEITPPAGALITGVQISEFSPTAGGAAALDAALDATTFSFPVPSYLLTERATQVVVTMRAQRAQSSAALAPQVRVLRAGTQLQITPSDLSQVYLPFLSR
jgi:hypothetical protein